MLWTVFKASLNIDPWSSLVEGGEGSYLPNCFRKNYILAETSVLLKKKAIFGASKGLVIT